MGGFKKKKKNKTSKNKLVDGFEKKKKRTNKTCSTNTLVSEFTK